MCNFLQYCRTQVCIFQTCSQKYSIYIRCKYTIGLSHLELILKICNCTKSTYDHLSVILSGKIHRQSLKWFYLDIRNVLSRLF